MLDSFDASGVGDAATGMMVWPDSCSLEATNPGTAVADAMSGLLNTINCLPGIGTLAIVVNSVRALHQALPFTGGYVPPEVRDALNQAMLLGGGCEIKLRTSQLIQVFGVCLGNGRWSGCSDKQVGRNLAIDTNEIAASFPAAGTVERIRLSSRRSERSWD
jgi:hypothetical protein